MTDAPQRGRSSGIDRAARETAIAIAVSALAVGAMAIDHLIGTETEPGEDAGLADPGAFLFSVVVSLAGCALVFGLVVRRVADDDADGAARRALALGLLAVPALGLLFLGVPFPLAGAAIALGLLGRQGVRKRMATAAVVVGALVVVVGTGAYVAALVA